MYPNFQGHLLPQGACRDWGWGDGHGCTSLGSQGLSWSQGAVFFLTYIGYHARLSSLKSNLKFSTMIHLKEKKSISSGPRGRREVHLWQSCLKGFTSQPNQGRPAQRHRDSILPQTSWWLLPVRWMSAQLSTCLCSQPVYLSIQPPTHQSLHPWAHDELFPIQHL